MSPDTLDHIVQHDVVRKLTEIADREIEEMKKSKTLTPEEIEQCIKARGERLKWTISVLRHNKNSIT